ncbi:hypothetical protein BJV78DRAFT_1154718 [Lactifluus subvellereus]|nr:hypothetical protein BJV78DRAFT_1154718 [Lactifluus subvellereus]
MAVPRPPAVDSTAARAMTTHAKPLQQPVERAHHGALQPHLGPIIAWANKLEREKDGQKLDIFTKLVFEKATNEEMFSEMYKGKAVNHPGCSDDETAGKVKTEVVQEVSTPAFLTGWVVQ